MLITPGRWTSVTRWWGGWSSWLVEEIVFLVPVDRRVSGAHSRLNLFGTAAKREDFTAEGFFDYWKTVHAPISSSSPGSSGYVV